MRCALALVAFLTAAPGAGARPRPVGRAGPVGPVVWRALRGGGDATAADLQAALDLRGTETACLVEVGASWCGPCQALKPVLANAEAASKGLLQVYCVDVDAEPAVASALAATQLPTCFSVRDGRLVDHFVGMPRSAEELNAFVMRAMADDDDADGAGGRR